MSKFLAYLKRKFYSVGATKFCSVNIRTHNHFSDTAE